MLRSDSVFALLFQRGVQALRLTLRLLSLLHLHAGLLVAERPRLEGKLEAALPAMEPAISRGRVASCGAARWYIRNVSHDISLILVGRLRVTDTAEDPLIRQASSPKAAFVLLD